MGKYQEQTGPLKTKATTFLLKAPIQINGFRHNS